MKTLAPMTALLVAVVAMTAHADAPRARGHLVVVVSAKSSVTNLKPVELRTLFLGEEIRDPAGHTLVPLNHPPGTPDRVEFDRKALGMTPDEVGRYWVDRRIRGQGHPPRSFSPVTLLLRLLERFPNAITYARSDELTAAVRVVTIDGKRPGERGYPLD